VFWSLLHLFSCSIFSVSPFSCFACSGHCNQGLLLTSLAPDEFITNIGALFEVFFNKILANALVDLERLTRTVKDLSDLQPLVRQESNKWRLSCLRLFCLRFGSIVNLWSSADFLRLGNVSERAQEQWRQPLFCCFSCLPGHFAKLPGKQDSCQQRPQTVSNQHEGY
jgi:hypothetical protein